MEWRIFFPIVEDVPVLVDIWPLLELRKCHRDKRTDIYLSCTDGVGLKLRGDKKVMEIKLRNSVHHCGTEEWHKWSPLGHSATADVDMIQRAFARELRKIQQSGQAKSGVKRSLEEALDATWPPRLVCIKKDIFKGVRGGISVEQCDIEVSGGLHKQTYWRSICFEASIIKIQKFLQKEVGPGKSLKEVLCEPLGSMVQGYPGFILRETT